MAAVCERVRVGCCQALTELRQQLVGSQSEAATFKQNAIARADADSMVTMFSVDHTSLVNAFYRLCGRCAHADNPVPPDQVATERR